MVLIIDGKQRREDKRNHHVDHQEAFPEQHKVAQEVRKWRGRRGFEQAAKEAGEAHKEIRQRNKPYS